jgi:hypothetical protein
MGTWMRIGCKVHLDVRSETGTVSAEAIRSQLASFRQSTSRFVIPTRAPGRHAELRWLDPNYCANAMFAGSDKLDWRLSQPRSRPSRDDAPARQRFHFNTLLDQVLRSISRLDHDYLCPPTFSCVETPCTTEGCVILSMETSYRVRRPGPLWGVNRVWFELLDVN